MKSIRRKVTSLVLVLAAIMILAPSAFTKYVDDSLNPSDYPIKPQTLGSGTVLWEETDMPDGWTMVTNEGGMTLGYTKGTGLGIIQVDGFAFKDLNKNGQLEIFEDWRFDFSTRARNLVETEELPIEWQMGLKMNPFNVGAANATELAEQTVNALNAGYRHIRFGGSNIETVVGWNNLMNKHIEALDMVFIPTTFIADPLGNNPLVSNWPQYLGIAASFDPELAAQYGRMLSKEWRSLGISMKVAPQIDLATEPRWRRTGMTFGEDPQLSSDMSVAMVNAWQSTYDEAGNDLGWAEHSVNCQIKHLPGDGAAESGRESHTLCGAFTVYPGGQFWTQFMPFLAALDLPGKTEVVSSAMTNFSIAVDGDGNSVYGPRVATSFNERILNEIWRGHYEWDGYILTDFAILRDGAKHYGVEDLTEAERFLMLLEAGNDGIGHEGANIEAAIELAMEAYELGVAKHGQAAMDEMLSNSTRRAINTFFNVGLVDNPYLTVEHAEKVARNPEHVDAAFDAQVRSLTMFKNSENVIKEATNDKQTVYIPFKYIPEAETRGRTTPASFAPTFNLETARQYFNVVTDVIGEPTGPNDADGKPTLTPDDVVRASAEEIAACDFALVKITSPISNNPTSTAFSNITGSGTAGYNDDLTGVPEDFEYLPISLQYRPYRADSMYVRFDSIGGIINEIEVEGIYGTETVTVKENRSYYGKTGYVSNEGDLDHVLYAASVADKVVVCVAIRGAMVFNEFESEVDAIIASWGSAVSDAAFLEVVSGNVEPSGLSPMQMPKDMVAVEKQYEDVPRDMDVHVDSDGNAYDFAFGLNWSGVINDARVAKYNVAPLVGINPFE